jgi:superfamily II DNA or RNA helicase
MSTRYSWAQLFQNAIPSSKKGVFYTNKQIEERIKLNPIGFYQYTKESEYNKQTYKCGQSGVNVFERISDQRGPSERETFLIVGFVPSDLALKGSEDQRILNELHNQEKCDWCYRLNPNETTKEWAIYPNDNPEEIWIDYLKNDIKKIDAKLTIWQMEALDKFISLLDEYKKKIMAELAARFGKTLLYLALFGQLKEQVMVVGSYCLTALSSFKKECYLYEQFSNFVVLDLYSDTFQSDFAYNLSKEKKIVVVVSLCGDKTGNSLRNNNARFLSKFFNKITVIDEADYGAHTKNCVPFVNLIGKGAPIILTTGTNSERAKGEHDDVDAFFKVTYLDMIMKASMSPKLLNEIKYDRAVEFEKYLAQVRFYRYSWGAFVQYLDEHELKYNPSFTKASKNVSKNQGFWIGLYKSLIGVSSITDANEYCLANCIEGEPDCVMQFVSMTNAQMKKLGSLSKSILNTLYEVVVVNGNEVKGEYAEQYVKNAIRSARTEGKKVWIIASQMCQRSFSIPDINVVLLTYDNGEVGATIQRMSRALTAGNDSKVGHIISLSIDGNRDDKIAPMILDAAKQVAEHEGIDIVTALKKVMKSTPIFQMGEDGYNLELNPDDYAREIFSSNSSHRIMMNNDRLMYDGCLDEIDFDTTEKQEQLKAENDFKKGKTFLESAKKSGSVESREEQTIINQRRNKLKQITDRTAYCVKEIRKHKKDMNLDTFVQLVETNTFVSKSIGVTPQEFRLLIEQKYIDHSLLSMYVGCES